jgi:hypothetical protein
VALRFLERRINMMRRLVTVHTISVRLSNNEQIANNISSSCSASSQESQMRKIVSVILLLIIFYAEQVEAGPTSRYYLTSGSEKRLTIISGDAFTQHPQGQTSYSECPIAVNGRIVTAGALWYDGPGGYYDLEGNFEGPAGSMVIPFHSAFWDGTTDGNFNYAYNFYLGGIYQFDSDWSGGTLLFDLPVYYLGITYDPSDDTFWLGAWPDDNIVEQRDRSGQLISSFEASAFSSRITSLALDYADGTLWLGSANQPGTYAQYSRDGNLLQIASYTFSDVTQGGEFDLSVYVEVITVEVDIKPGSFPSSINLKSKGVIPVAIHTTDEFDAADVNPASVSLEECTIPVKWEMYDCDELPNPLYGNPLLPDEPEMIGDDDIDLVLYFETRDLVCLDGLTEVTLTGITFDNIPIVGTSDISFTKQGKP